MNVAQVGVPRVAWLTAATLLVLPGGINSQQGPAVRQLGPLLAMSRDSLASAAAVVEVSGGRVFVNDITARRLLLYDSALATRVVVADSAGNEGEMYGERPGTLLPYRGDSVLLITPSSLSMLVLTAEGRVERVIAMPPTPTDIPALIGSIFGTPGFDERGRLVYFAPVRFDLQPPLTDLPQTFEQPDSALLVRFDFATRALDTVGAIRIPKSRSRVTRDGDGRPLAALTAFPPGVVDDWAVTSDGRLAVVRGGDYHIDWLESGDRWRSTPRLPYAWAPLDDALKTALIDSAAAARQAFIDSIVASLRATVAGRTREVRLPGVARAELSDVPDYRPAFDQGAVRADRDGNLWIRTNHTSGGEPVYDVVNGRGELSDRVKLAPHRQIAGFGRGAVYLGVRDDAGVVHVERLRLR